MKITFLGHASLQLEIEGALATGELKVQFAPIERGSQEDLARRFDQTAKTQLDVQKEQLDEDKKHNEKLDEVNDNLRNRPLFEVREVNF